MIIELNGQPTLKSVFKDHFLIGAAINQAEFTGVDTVSAAIIKREFNSISPENVLKWANIHPQPDIYNFTEADKYVEFGEKNNMFIIGHTLVWHQEAPKWIFYTDKGEEVDRETLLKRLRDHIFKVVGRYKGKIKGWDVVNEALDEEGGLRKSLWLKIIGEDYIAKAFEFAHEADPNAELYYNDYNIEQEGKKKGTIKIVKELLAKKIPIHAVGIQGHYKVSWPSAAIVDSAIQDFEKLGLKVNITELDIDILPDAFDYLNIGVFLNLELTELNPYPKKMNDEAEQELTNRYVDLFKVFLKHKNIIERITFWGVTDKDTWLNDWPIVGRSSYPLLFDREGKRKAVYEAILKLK